MSVPMPRVQSVQSLRQEMIAVARGERDAPTHAAEPSFHSVDLITRLLTPENRQLMAVIRDKHPQSVAQLAALTNRAASNVTRTLEKLAAAGLVSFRADGRKKVPETAVGRILIEIDPFAVNDTITVQSAGYVRKYNTKAMKRQESAGGKRRSVFAKSVRAKKANRPETGMVVKGLTERPARTVR